MTTPLAIDALLSSRVRQIEVSGIRAIWERAATLTDPIDLSIGQPDFAVPDALKDAAIAAIRDDHNGYTMTGGDAALRDALRTQVADEFGWSVGAEADSDVIVTSGTAGALTLACLALLDRGDELIIPDPWFVIYPALATIAGGRAVTCDTYGDFRMTAERIEPLITDRTKALLLNTPANPTGVVLSDVELADIVALCAERGILLITDEIYDRFVFPPLGNSAPTPATVSSDLLLVRGFGKTYGCTGWRMGYVAGPRLLITEMAKLQQHTFVCASSIAQQAMLAAPKVDLSPLVARFAMRRDMVVDALGDVTDLVVPEGAFYAFPAVAEGGEAFCQRAMDAGVLVIPGHIFSSRDTHVRISLAADEARLEQGLQILRGLMR